jgi:GNAT superfamily N-acetyltransferase
MFKTCFHPPSTEGFIHIRQSVGWDNPEKSVVSNSIKNSLFWVCLYKSERLVATGRVIGDGAMYFYIQDIIVAPEYQGRGLARTLMESIEVYLSQECKKHATVGLLSVKGKEAFYNKFDYLLRDGNKLGHGMCKFIK